MVLEKFYVISQVVAALAVIGSLVFVGLQMGQSDKTQRAIMHQERTHRNIGVVRMFLEPHHQAMLTKSRDAELARSLSGLVPNRSGVEPKADETLFPTGSLS